MAKKKNWLEERLEQETDEGVIENLLWMYGDPKLYDEVEDEDAEDFDEEGYNAFWY